MAADPNVVEVVLRANVGDFQRRIQQGTDTLRVQFGRATREVTSDSERIRQATRRLGVRPFGELNVEIRRLQRDYERLARSGQLSSRELALANVRMREGVRELRREQSGWVQSLTQARVQILAAGAATFTLVRALSAASREYRAFEEGIAAVNSLLDVSPARIDELSAEVRALAEEMGVDATGATQALYDIISAGVPQENGIEVLRASTRAAIAGLTDTQTAARVGLAVINAYGKEVGDLGNVFDVLFQTVRGGVTTLPELSAQLGQVLPVAAGSGIAFETVAAAVQRLTQSGLNTAQAVTALRGAIVNLTAPGQAAGEALDELGVSTGDFLSTLRQIGELDLGPEGLREIVPDVEARNAVLALTQDLGGLSEAIESVSDSSGAADEAYGKLAGSSAQTAREFSAAVTELQLQIGELVAAGTPLLEVITELLRGFNGLPAPVKQTAAAVLGVAGAATVLRLGLAPVLDTLRLLLPALARFGSVARLLAAGPIGLAAVALFELGSAVAGVVQESREAAADIAAVERGLRELEETSGDAADTQRLTREEVAALTDEELRSYQTRLAAARDYYQELERLDERRPDLVAGDPAVQVQQYDEALAAATRIIDRRQAERERLERAHGQRLAGIKEAELQAIKRSLAEQVGAYEDANERLEEVRNEREEVAKAFRELESELTAPTETPDEDLTAADLARQGDLVQGALNDEDPEEALRRAERAREIIRALAQQGSVTQQFLVSQTRRFAELADQAGGAQEAQAEQEVAEVRRQIEELAGRADFLRRIEIGFDLESARRSTESLRQELQQRLERNPIILPVRLAGDGGGGDNQAVDDILEQLPARAGGGPIRGPGTGTSDSILARVSDGEYVVRAAAVQRYGEGLFRALNQLRLPRFAEGGLVQRLQVPSLPSAPARGAGDSGRPLTLVLDGRRHSARVDGAAGDSLERQLRLEALKAGR